MAQEVLKVSLMGKVLMTTGKEGVADNGPMSLTAWEIRMPAVFAYDMATMFTLGMRLPYQRRHVPTANVGAVAWLETRRDRRPLEGRLGVRAGPSGQLRSLTFGTGAVR